MTQGESPDVTLGEALDRAGRRSAERTAERVVLALAESDAPVDRADMTCTLCKVVEVDEERIEQPSFHASSCPWRLAREWVNRQRPTMLSPHITPISRRATRPQTCQGCGGSGRMSCVTTIPCQSHTGPDCQACGGSGTVTCPGCNGSGGLACSSCGGSGTR